jgi:hypothetical protein
MPTFGKTDIGETAYLRGGNKPAGSRFTLSEGGTITEISACLYADSGTINAKVAVYDVDGSNDPNNLVAVSDEVTSIDTSQNTWHNFTINAELTAGEYYLVLITSGDARWYGTTTGERHYKYSGSYPNFTDPWGTGGSNAVEYSIYATYTTGGATYTKTWQTDVLFKKLDITRTFGTDSAFKKPDVTKNLTADVAFQKSFITQKQVDSFFKRSGILKGFAVDARFGVLMTQTLSRQIDVLLKKQDATKLFGLDVHFGSVEAETYMKALALDVIFAYKVRLPELWLDENGKLVLNISKPYAWVGT